MNILYILNYVLHFLRMKRYGLPISYDEIARVTVPPKGPYDHKNWPASYYALDFIVPNGTRVLAVASGRVVAATDKYGEWGLDVVLANKTNIVVIDHEDGFFSEYIHLEKNSVRVSVGDFVKRGDYLGKTGMSGCMDSPHLHFNVFSKGKSVPPGTIFSQIKKKFYKR